MFIIKVHPIGSDIYLFLAGQGLELRDSCLLTHAFLPLEPFHQPFSVMDFFEIGSWELFAQG
jgi:hypothetical protein